jgi:hypothetical protein
MEPNIQEFCFVNICFCEAPSWYLILVKIWIEYSNVLAFHWQMDIPSVEVTDDSCDEANDICIFLMLQNYAFVSCSRSLLCPCPFVLCWTFLSLTAVLCLTGDACSIRCFFGEPLVESRVNAMVINVDLVFQGHIKPIIVVWDAWYFTSVQMLDWLLLSNLVLYTLMKENGDLLVA